MGGDTSHRSIKLQTRRGGKGRKTLPAVRGAVITSLPVYPRCRPPSRLLEATVMSVDWNPNLTGKLLNLRRAKQLAKPKLWKLSRDRVKVRHVHYTHHLPSPSCPYRHRRSFPTFHGRRQMQYRRMIPGRSVAQSRNP
jgi:hypothetical protein